MPASGSQPDWKDLRLGMIVTAVLALVVLVVFFSGATRGPFLPDTYELVLDLSDAGGIRVGSPVRVGGLPAGEVIDLEMVPPREALPPLASDTLEPVVVEPDLSDIRLTLEIEEQFREHVTTSSRAQLTSLGLGGERFVQISPGDIRKPPLEPGTKIPAVASVDWDLLLAKLSRALNETSEITAIAEQLRVKATGRSSTVGLLLVDDASIYTNMRALEASSRRLLETLEEGEGVISRSRGDDRLANGLDSLWASVKRIERSLAEDESALARWREPAELDRALTELDASLAALDSVIGGGYGSLGRLLYDEELFVQIRVLQRDIARLVETLTDDPLGSIRIRIF